MNGGYKIVHQSSLLDKDDATKCNKNSVNQIKITVLIKSSLYTKERPITKHRNHLGSTFKTKE